MVHDARKAGRVRLMKRKLDLAPGSPIECDRNLDHFDRWIGVIYPRPDFGVMAGVDPQNPKITADSDRQQIRIAIDLSLERRAKIDPLAFANVRSGVDRDGFADRLASAHRDRRCIGNVPEPMCAEDQAGTNATKRDRKP